MMAPTRGIQMSTLLLIAVGLMAFSGVMGWGHDGGWGNDGWGNGGGSSSRADAHANARSESRGGGRSSATADASASASSRGGGGWGGGWGGKRLLSVPSSQDFLTSLGFGPALINHRMPAPDSVVGTQTNNIVELPDHFEVFVILPEFTTEDSVSAEIDEGILMIYGQKTSAGGPKQVSSHSSSKSSSSFSHSLAIPANIKANEMTAHLSDGILMVKLPKQ